jgi:thiol-disulfide isomerase/thioredoxin
MARLFIILSFLSFTSFIFSQQQQFEISGTFLGEHKNKIYLFFENDFGHRDSIFTTINEKGQFTFKLKNTLPILCRVHCGDKSSGAEFYADNSKTQITFTSYLTEKDTPDSLGGARANFSIKEISGSESENRIRSFKEWNEKLENSNQTDLQKHSLYYDKLKSIVAAFPKSKASAYLIAGRIYIMGKAFMFPGDFPLSYSEFTSLTSLLDSALNNSLEGENLNKILKSLEANLHISLNDPFYNVSLPDSSGQRIDTKIFRNKYVLIDCWASWCRPCRAMTPDLKKLYTNSKEKGFEIIGISIDTDSKAWKKAIIEDRVNWTELNDTAGTEGLFCKHYDIRAIPALILIDKEGKIIAFPKNITETENLLKLKLNN